MVVAQKLEEINMARTKNNCNYNLTEALDYIHNTVDIYGNQDFERTDALHKVHDMSFKDLSKTLISSDDEFLAAAARAELELRKYVAH